MSHVPWIWVRVWAYDFLNPNVHRSFGFVGPKYHAGCLLLSSLRYLLPTPPSTISLCARSWRMIRLPFFTSWSTSLTKSLTFLSSSAGSRSNAASLAGESGSWLLCSKIWWFDGNYGHDARASNSHSGFLWEKLWRRPGICSSLVEMEVKFICRVFQIA